VPTFEFAFKHEPAHGAKGATHDHSPCIVVSLPRRVFDRLLASPDNESPEAWEAFLADIEGPGCSGEWQRGTERGFGSHSAI